MSTTMVPPVPTVPAASVATADARPERRVAETGVWIAIATISMSFAAAYQRARGAAEQRPRLAAPAAAIVVVRQHARAAGQQHDARVVAAPPRILRPTCDAAARSAVPRRSGVFAWRQLATQNVLLATGPSSAFFYVFTVLHALHVLGDSAG